jgi:hypothetical protein
MVLKTGLPPSGLIFDALILLKSKKLGVADDLTLLETHSTRHPATSRDQLKA